MVPLEAHGRALFSEPRTERSEIAKGRSLCPQGSAGGRWQKTFDELKNKLGETKAWASSAKAKAMQAHFLCLAHNLMILCEAELARVHGVRNEAEINRRAQRLAKEEERLAQQNLLLPLLVRTLPRLTVRSVKFIRWLRVQLFARPHHPPAIAALRQLYAVL